MTRVCDPVWHILLEKEINKNTREKVHRAEDVLLFMLRAETSVFLDENMIVLVETP